MPTNPAARCATPKAPRAASYNQPLGHYRLMREQDDEWPVSRRYMPVEKLTAMCNDYDEAVMIAAQRMSNTRTEPRNRRAAGCARVPPGCLLAVQQGHQLNQDAPPKCLSESVGIDFLDIL